MSGNKVRVGISFVFTSCDGAKQCRETKSVFAIIPVYVMRWS